MTDAVTNAAEPTVVPLSPIRKAIADRMVQSKTEAPHAYVVMDVPMAAALRFREEFNAGGHGNAEGARISVNDLVVKAAALALRQVPAVNATFEDGAVVMHPSVNVGVVVAIEGDEGILVPVIPGTDTRTLPEMSAEIRAKAELARKKRLRASDSRGGTFTISNVGMFGVTYLVAVVQPPQVGILGVGAVTQVAVVEDGQVVAKPVMGVALSFDHRAVDGAVAAKFLAAFTAVLQAPEQLL
ncbi:MAG: Dihydrolipoyllysine-residue acetyltransferase component of pyruvate dehydrogenase complex [bacterium ADurb.Bin429]|nr:MAG: Dihydrolipoyllysine-residue acetyltransferase component of pyruvate dehydrogenase complex [bacterium ADurb.Bin429]